MPLLEVVRRLLDEKWDLEREEYSLPPLLALIVGEPGFGGSHTPSMVGAIQNWRKKQPEKAQYLWSELGQANMNVEKGLLEMKQIAKDNEDGYRMALESCKGLVAEQWIGVGGYGDIHESVVTSLVATRHAFEKVRSLLREIGDAAGVPIEPPPQTVLLDASMNMEGVLLAGVPGAGGYDAVFAVTIGSSARDIVEKEWSARGVLALRVVEDPRGVQLEGRDPRQEGTLGLHALKLES